MNTPLLTFIYDRKHKATATKEAPVELRITYGGKQKYMTTGVRLLPKQWKAGHVVGRLDSMEVQQTLDLLMQKARKVVNAMISEGAIILDEIPSRMANAGQVTFIEYCRSRAEVRKAGRAEDSQERYDRFLRWFTAWGGIVHFSDITDHNILAMDHEIKKDGMKPYSAWNNYHRFLNSFILDAQADGLIKSNPYKRINIAKEKSKGGIGKYLTPDEFKRIEALQMASASLERVRDLFIFQTYTCLSYTDLASFDLSKAVDVNGRKMYTANRGKTGQEFTFLLLKPAEAILEKYGGKLPIISNVKYNAYLKAVAAAAGIDKPVSSHYARHTGATLLLNEGKMNMEVVAKVLGHSSTKITRQVYAKLLDETVLGAMTEFEENL